MSEELKANHLLLKAPAQELEARSVDYTIRFNKYTELVELVDKRTNKLIQTIPPHELIQLISELRYTSGLFVDSEI